MKISILSAKDTWLNDWIVPLCEELTGLSHTLDRVFDVSRLKGGDVCLILNSQQILTREQLALHRHNLVAHASDLPRGRGMSPLNWQILEGKNRITLTLFEADTALDGGDIYLQRVIEFEGHELLDEMQATLAKNIHAVCLEFVKGFPGIVEQARKQQGEASYYRTRTPADSELDPRRSLAEQFSLLRVVDNQRYPAFFRWQGKKYRLIVDKMED
jgi:methionyl-tRNA formyltransferase